MVPASSTVFIALGLATSVMSTMIDLSLLDGDNGFSFIGSSDDYSGYSVSNVGDFNNDGYGDIIIGAVHANVNTGAVYLVYGASTFDFDSFSADNLDGSNGFVINGVSINDHLGVSVSAAGDVNNDGYDDIIIGADHYNTNSGQVYILYGGQGVGSTGVFELKDLDQSHGVIFDGETSGDYAGSAVGAAGDVNLDGYDDIIIGAYGVSVHGTNSGRAYVIYGGLNLGGKNGIVQLGSTNFTDSDGFMITGTKSGSKCGFSVSGAGDINNDGYDDIIVGSSFYGGGEGYVVFGASSVKSVNADSDALDGENGFILKGDGSYDYLGNSVSGAGDFNGDGYDDIIIGAYFAVSGEGIVYLVYGGPHVGTEGEIQVDSLSGSSGFKMIGESTDETGYSVSGGGDIDGDGYFDVIIGAPYAHPNDIVTSGKSFIVYGDSDVGGSIYLNSYNVNGVVTINGAVAHELSGYSVSSAGDFNGDGTIDVIIGACGYGVDTTNSGISYVVMDLTPPKKDKDNKNKFDDNIVYIVIAGVALILISYVCFHQCTKKQRHLDNDDKSDLNISVVVNASDMSPNLQESLLEPQGLQQDHREIYQTPSAPPASSTKTVGMYEPLEPVIAGDIQ